MESQHEQGVRYEDDNEESYEDPLTGPDSALQPSTLPQEHEDPSSTQGGELPRQLANFADVDDLFGPNAGNLDEYYQNLGTQQPFLQEASAVPISNNVDNDNIGTYQPFGQGPSTIPIADNMNSIDDSGPLFSGAGHDFMLGSEPGQMASFTQLPDLGQGAYPIVDNGLATSGPEYENADFVNLPGLNDSNGYANVHTGDQMRSRVYLHPEYSQGPFPSVPNDLILGSNDVSKDPNTASASSSVPNSSIGSDTTLANSYHHALQWPDMGAPLSDPEGLHSQHNTNAVPSEAGAASGNIPSVADHLGQWQDPAPIQYRSTRNPARTEVPGYQGRLPQNTPRQYPGFSDAVDFSNGSRLDLEGNFSRSNELVYSPYLARGGQHGPLETSNIQAAHRITEQFPPNLAYGSDVSYADSSFNGLSQNSRQLNEPYLQHRNNTPYIYEGGVPFTTDMSRRQFPMNDGSTLALDLQMTAQRISRKRFARFDEEEEEEGEEDEEAYLDYDEYNQPSGSHMEHESIQASK